MDAAWALLFVAFAAASPYKTDAEFELLGALALVQISEPRIPLLATPPGALLAIGVKLLLAYLLVGVSGGVTSSYYLLLLVPVVSAVTLLGTWGTAVLSVMACALYLSFLLWIDWNRYVLPRDQVQELGIRVLSFGGIALMMHQLAQTTRSQARLYREMTEKLGAANKSLADAEAAVRRSERLAALGQLTAGLAHELRNPLGTMKASAEVLLKSLPADEGVPRELAGYIRDEVDRTNSLVTRFLDFARPMELRRDNSDLNQIIDRAITQLERHHPPFSITVHRNYSPDARPAPLDSQLMERVFYNLLLNAAQASSEGGPVTVKTRVVPGGVEAAVIDRGSGIEGSQRENIFNPFFTTKPGGTGLGLAIVSKIIDQHGGRIAVESEPGQGSVFRVVLPAAA